MSEKDLKCLVCAKNFKSIYNLTQHQRKFHKEQADLIEKKTYNYQCEECNKNFSHLKHLNYHRKTHMNLRNVGSASKHAECPVCRLAISRENIINHLKEEHDIECVTENFEFTSFEEFTSWKTNMEHDTKSKYISLRGFQCNKNGTKTIKYSCHRSGKYIPKGKGIRHLKTQGSNKIGSFCPAHLKVMVNTNNECKVSLMKQHVGHDVNDLGHLQLTLQERKSLANKMALKIPFTQILDDVRDSVVGSQLERIHLLSRKDLYNIEQNFQLQSTVVRHPNDGISVDIWAKERENSGCILFYKPQETESENHPTLKKEDFVLIYMNPGQENVLKKYASDCICVDGTHGLNQYDFEMHTLMVIDDLRQGFPCAFLISNRSDEVVLKIFFQHIKEKIGYQIGCKTFMSDMAESYYNAWKLIMGTAQYRLFCTWHVDRSWRKNLTKINTKEKQVMVYKYLRTLLHERDENAFLRMLNKFIATTTDDPDTVGFAEYFKNNYVNNRYSWAYCHRLYSGLNTNMSIERMHLTIKYIYFNGRKVKRLDKALHEIEKFIKDRLFNQITTLFKGKISHKIKELRARHVNSQKLSLELLVANGSGWEIPSSNSLEVYKIEERVVNGVACFNCQLMCTDCNACIHRYSCTCIDSCIKFNMCKHIHLLCRYLRQQNTQILGNTNSDENNLLIVEDPKMAEVSEIMTGVTSYADDSFDPMQLSIEKQKLIDNFVQHVESINCMEQVNAIKKMHLSLGPTLEAIATKEGKLCMPSVSFPHNKKIIPQRGKLHSTKKKKSKVTASVSTPTNEEMQDIAIKLLFN